ncbi:MAG: 3-deoxy-D-manno-octulosonic acid transferase [Candidatus Omnitrophica bacterium]|nr:3-deoxy-D-manno-octulosonic acid transferase [Candidatus Omnitrophota bacterium]
MLYDTAFLIFSLFYLPTLIFKGKMHADFGERFGHYAQDKRKALASLKGAIWIQAVSVGEVAACRGLVDRLKIVFPDRKVLLSTITKTGNDLARKLFGNDAVIIYFPLDLSWIVKKAVSLVNPSLYIMIETEIWPNMIREVSLRGIPSAIVNGRISDRSFGKYKLAKPFLSKTMKRIGVFCMQSLQDAERIIGLGAPKERVRVTGNMKFDADVSVDIGRSEYIKRSMGMADSDTLLVAGSTHKGEEVIVLQVFKKLSAEFPRLKLLIAPRHIERTGEVEEAIKSFGLTSVRFSSICGTQDLKRAPQIFILDSIGKLRDIYSISTIVFMGGSLVPHGGQNPIEPAALGKPVIFGPYMFNFREITAAFLDNGAAILVKESEELFDSIKMLLTAPERLSEMTRCAGLAITEKRGATQRNMKELESLSAERSGASPKGIT